MLETCMTSPDGYKAKSRVGDRDSQSWDREVQEFSQAKNLCRNVIRSKRGL